MQRPSTALRLLGKYWLVLVCRMNGISHKPAHAVPTWQAPASTRKTENPAGQRGAHGGGCVGAWVALARCPLSYGIRSPLPHCIARRLLTLDRGTPKNGQMK